MLLFEFTQHYCKSPPWASSFRIFCLKPNGEWVIRPVFRVEDSICCAAFKSFLFFYRMYFWLHSQKMAHSKKELPHHAQVFCQIVRPFCGTAKWQQLLQFLGNTVSSLPFDQKGQWPNLGATWYHLYKYNLGQTFEFFPHH